MRATALFGLVLVACGGVDEDAPEITLLGVGGGVDAAGILEAGAAWEGLDTVHEIRLSIGR